MLEWVGGGISTVSLHTFERSKEVSLALGDGYSSLSAETTTSSAILRSDPTNKLAVLSLPGEAIAMIPFVQDLMEHEDLLEHGGDDSMPSYAREVPYLPSYVLPNDSLRPPITGTTGTTMDARKLRNIRDLAFLHGFNDPTLAILYEPRPHWVGRLGTEKDSYALDILTMDVITRSYPSLATVTSLPCDALYLSSCPAEIGGMLLVCSSSLIHIDQSGKKTIVSINGWFQKISNLIPSRKDAESLMLELNGSHIAWNKLIPILVLADGTTYHLGIKMDGRSVSDIEIHPAHTFRSKKLARPSAIVAVGNEGVFVASATGDSELYRCEVRAVKEITKDGKITSAEQEDLDADIHMEDDLEDGEYYQLLQQSHGTPHIYIMLLIFINVPIRNSHQTSTPTRSYGPIFQLLSKLENQYIYTGTILSLRSAQSLTFPSVPLKRKQEDLNSFA